MTSQSKYRISVRAVILSLSSYFCFPFVKPGDRLKFGGRVWVFGTGRPFSGRVHDVLQLVLGWSGQAFYNFRIHGQEIGRRRHLRTQLRRREKVLYTYDFLDLREREMRVLDIEPDRQKPGGPVAWQAAPRRHRKSAALRDFTAHSGECEKCLYPTTLTPKCFGPITFGLGAKTEPILSRCEPDGNASDPGAISLAPPP